MNAADEKPQENTTPLPTLSGAKGRTKPQTKDQGQGTGQSQC